MLIRFEFHNFEKKYNMLIHKSSWNKHLSTEFEKPYFIDLMQQVDNEYNNYTCFPPKELIFNAFNQFNFEDLKVVILGQDPYHGNGEANGLCFSVNDGIAIPPSLKNIFAEINHEFERIVFPPSGNLERWARQGVLLLNATLTVRRDQPNSHKHLNWQLFTDAVIKKISNEKEHVVFMLWGNFAKKKSKLIDKSKHEIIENGHPSPLSYNKGKWDRNIKNFTAANNYLIKHKIKPIDW